MLTAMGSIIWVDLVRSTRALHRPVRERIMCGGEWEGCALQRRVVKVVWSVGVPAKDVCEMAPA